ncbi:transmembrane protein 145-like [Actinia tenebrosa]|uniref:Transmembrane protein 145-like n=1 Tax=Actinia tenebrosa TaxID=6105 RepID=A0A6P8IQA6_ACTTE|nr:transmembrane protein 145-like [Actinia tenebrosa]
MFKTLWTLVVFISVLWKSDAKYVEGYIHTSSSWVFVTRFVFLNEEGKLDYKVEYLLTNECCPSLVFYYDDHWSEVYPRHDMHCSSKLKFASKYHGSNLLQFKLDSSSNAINCENYLEHGVHFRRCSGVLRFIAIRSRWWFLVLSHCDDIKPSPLNVKYEFTITNGDSWDRHLSADDTLMVEITIAFLIIFTFAFVIGLAFARHLSVLKFLHRPYRVFIISLGYEETALIFETIYYMEYIVNGKQSMSIQTTGAVFHAVSEIMFIILLLLLAKGFTITRGKLSSFNQIKIATFALIYGIFYIVLFVWKTELFDNNPGVVRNDFDNYAGRTIISLRISAWVWFVYTSISTVCCYPEKKGFYCWFCACFSVWFLLKPSLILWSYMNVKSWKRVRILKGVDLLICAIAYTIFLFLTRPTDANKNFPFHVRTNQVEAMTDKEAEDFPHTEEFSRIGKRQEGWIEASFTDLERAKDENELQRDGISSAWFSRKA